MRNRLLAAALFTLALAGCAQPLTVSPAPYAADPDCARVMLVVPEVVGGLPVRGTTSQATQAWGEEFPIVARCGVEPPGPSPEPCVSVDTPSGSVDWLVSEVGENWVAVTFGRSPALEVTVPAIRADEAVRDVLAEFTSAAALAPVNGLECS
jgi:hypothetical protein